MSEAALAATAARPTPARISCVLPAYNEVGSLQKLIVELGRVLGSLSPKWEIIVVDDGSSDETPLLMAALVDEQHIVSLRLSRNFGKEIALAAGLDAARGDVVCFLDADGQHPPELLTALFERWLAGVDMVYTVRVDRSDEKPLQRLAARIYYTLMRRLSGIEMPAHAGDFRLMDRRVADALRSLPERNRYMKGLYAWVGFRSEAMPYVPHDRLHGKTRFNWRQLFSLALDGLTSFTTFPLRLWTTVGFFLSLTALVYGGYLLVEFWVRGHSMPSWLTLAVGIMFLSGIQLLSIGILGEYIGRIFDEVKQRPLYFVASRRGRGLDDNSADHGES